jgi:hypothetical protein
MKCDSVCSRIILSLMMFWSFFIPRIQAQEVTGIPAPKYVFKTGKEYVYMYSFKQVDLTNWNQYHGDSFLSTRMIAICAREGDSLAGCKIPAVEASRTS